MVRFGKGAGLFSHCVQQTSGQQFMKSICVCSCINT